MELKLEIYTIIVRDDSIGQGKIVKTVRKVEEIVGYLEETEKDALSDAIYRLSAQ